MYLVGKKFCLFVIYSRDLDFRGGMTLEKKTSSNLNEGSEKTICRRISHQKNPEKFRIFFHIAFFNPFYMVI